MLDLGPGPFRPSGSINDRETTMLAPRIVLDFVTAEPFRPFRMYMASGRTFDVGHPEMIRVGRSSVTVHMRPDGDTAQAERWQEVSLMLLESIEPFEAPTRQRSE
jgi:hypothetical protein